MNAEMDVDQTWQARARGDPLLLIGASELRSNIEQIYSASNMRAYICNGRWPTYYFTVDLGFGVPATSMEALETTTRSVDIIQH